jgi:Family of unknown function (DUF5681)
MNLNEAEVLSQPQKEERVRADEATRWKPGHSGNPGGRPKRTPLIDACRAVLAKPVPGIRRAAPTLKPSPKNSRQKRFKETSALRKSLRIAPREKRGRLSRLRTQRSSRHSSA